MSRIKAIIYTSSNIENNLVFENEDILAISTNTKCIENENLPEFDVFPNSGTLTVKDRNLDIYNKAINGIFDNYEYKVEYYLEDKIIATHIINQRPRYDYDAKTCTFYLGNSLDSLVKQTFEPYAYPLESQTLYKIFQEVLKRIFNIDEDEYKRLMAGAFGDYKVGETTYTNLTFGNYFEKINITYPYISQTNSREALKTILLIAQCGLYLDEENKLQLVRLDGYSNAIQDDYYENVYKLEPHQTNKGFVPSVILDNKFNKFNLDYFGTKTVINVNSPAYVFEEQSLSNGNYFLSGNGFSSYAFEESFGTNSDYPAPKKGTWNAVCNDEQPVSTLGNEYYIRCVQARLQRIYQYTTPTEKEYFSIYQNNNLKEIISLLNEGRINWNVNPTIIITCKKIVETSQQAFKAHHSPSVDGPFTPFENSLNTNIIEEYITFDAFNLTKSFTLKINDLGNSWTNVPLEITIPYTNDGEIIDMRIFEENLFKLNFWVCCGIQVETLSGSTISTTKLEKNGYFISTDTGIKQVIKIIPVKIDITYNGTTKEIVFDKSSYSKKFKEDQTISYENTLQASLELNQKTSSINQTNTQEVIATNLLSSFNQGLHTGTITVIDTNYNTYLPTDTSQIGSGQGQRRLFKIGDKVMPYKDKPIINRVDEGVEEPVVFQIVDCETFNESGATFQNLVLREIKKPTT